MDRRKFFRGALIASAVVGVEASRASQADAFFWLWWCPKLDAPSLQVEGVKFTVVSLTVTAGCNGAPAGFTVQWMKKSDYVANCNRWFSSSDPRLCKAVFVPDDCNSPYYLTKNESVSVPIGALPPEIPTNCAVLDQLTEYVFRAFAHGAGCYKSSDASKSVCAITAPVEPPPK